MDGSDDAAELGRAGQEIQSIRSALDLLTVRLRRLERRLEASRAAGPQSDVLPPELFEVGEAAEPPDDGLTQLDELKLQVAELRAALDESTARLGAMEARLREPRPAPSAEERPLELDVPAVAGPVQLDEIEIIEPPEVVLPESLPPVEPSPAAPAKPGAPSRLAALEERLGTRWFNWVGILAILFAAAYFVKYALDQQWITDRMLFGGGLVFGAAMMAAGFFTQSKHYPILARGFWGGGVSLLLLDLFAGHKLLGDAVTGPLVSQPSAFAGMVATTLAGGVIAVVYRSRSVVTLSAVGAYLVPLLLGIGPQDQALLFTYLAIVTAGLLVISHLRAWRRLPTLAFMAALLFFGFWWTDHYPGRPALTVAFTTTFFLLFSADAMVWSAVRRRAPHWTTTPRLAANSILYGLATWSVLGDFHAPTTGTFMLALAAYHFGCSVTTARRLPEARGLVRLLAHLAAVAFLLFPVVEDGIDDHWITIAWSLQGLALFAGGAWRAERKARAWGLVGIGLAAFRLLAIEVPGALADVVPYRILLSARGLTFGVAILAYWGVVALHRLVRLPARPEDEERRPWIAGDGPRRLCRSAVLFMAVTLPITLVSLEVGDAFTQVIKPHFEWGRDAYLHHMRHWTTLIWLAYSTLVLTLARRRGEPVLQWAGFAFGAVVLAKLVFLDLAGTYVRVATALVNTRCLTLAAQVACLLYLGWELKRRRALEALPNVGAACAVLGHVLLQATLCMEWCDLCAALGWDARGAGAMSAAAPLGAAVLMAVHGTALVWYTTMRRHSRALLGAGLWMLCIGVIWWLVNAVGLERDTAVALVAQFRFGAGAAVAALAFAASAALRARPEVDPKVGQASASPALAVAGHVTTIVVLSLEVADLFVRQAHVWRPDAAVSVINGAGFPLAALWGVYGTCLLAAGLRLGRRHLRATGLVALALSLAYALFWNVGADYQQASTVVLNTRFMGAGLAVAGLFCVAELYRRAASPPEPSLLGGQSESRLLGAPMLLAAHGITILLLTLEASDFFSLRLATLKGLPSWMREGDARSMSFSVIWAVYAIGMVLAGFARQYRPVRLMALVILLGTIVKVFLLDLSFLEGLPRVLSFFVLGVILVGVSFLYQRHRDSLLGTDAADADEGASEAGQG